jgi:nitroreductase
MRPPRSLRSRPSTGSASGRSSLGLARYLPTNVDDPDTACLAEAAQVGPLTGGEAPYAFAGIETDISVEALEQIAEAGGQPVYADPGGEQPPAELFIAGDAGLLRFLITDESGLPTALPTDIPFGEAVYAFEVDVTDQVDLGALTRVGCVGPVPGLRHRAAGGGRPRRPDPRPRRPSAT